MPKFKKSFEKKISEKIKKYLPYFIGCIAIISISFVVVININININIDFDPTYILSVFLTLLLLIISFFLCILFAPYIMEQYRSTSRN